ncbi:MAG TPA: tetratricopeptide repeat protein, partial [bacterium]|nr:tetratricopeptide repeat protein [bacterium]
DDINVLYHFVKAAARCGELEEAAAVARRCVENPPPGTPEEIVQASAVQLSRLELQRGHHEEAMTVLADALERRPDDPVARFFMGDLLRRQGDLEGARRELEAARVSPVRFDLLPVPVAGLNRAIRMQLGEIQEILGRPAEAAAVYREAYSQQLEDAALGRALARALVAAGATADALGILDRLPEDPAHRHELMLLRATAAFDEARDDEAERLFAQVEQDNPRMWAAALHRGHLRLRRADIRGALPHYERALGLADVPETRVGLAAAQLEAGLLTACLDNLAEAVDQCSTRPLPHGTEALSGEALLRFGRPQEAQGAFERHLRRYGPDARVVSRLADCYREMGAGEAARVGYQEALKLDDSLDEARRGLARLETVH